MWKDIPDYEGIYQISESGDVKSLSRQIIYDNGITITTKEKILSPRLGGRKDCQYYSVILCNNSKRKQYKIHRIVAKLFCEKIEGNDVVNHIDNNRLNNHYTNLEWTTVYGNNAHIHKQGRSSSAKGMSNGRCKLTDNEVLEIKQHLKNGFLNQTELGLMYNVHSSTIYKIKNNMIRI